MAQYLDVGAVLASWGSFEQLLWGLWADFYINPFFQPLLQNSNSSMSSHSHRKQSPGRPEIQGRGADQGQQADRHLRQGGCGHRWQHWEVRPRKVRAILLRQERREGGFLQSEFLLPSWVHFTGWDLNLFHGRMLVIRFFALVII